MTTPAIANNRYAKDIANTLDYDLSVYAESADRQSMSISSHLFSIHERCDRKTWFS